MGNKTMTCEWCEPDPDDAPANKPESCTVKFCEKCRARTWHWPKPIREVGDG